MHTNPKTTYRELADRLEEFKDPIPSDNREILKDELFGARGTIIPALRLAARLSDTYLPRAYDYAKVDHLTVDELRLRVRQMLSNGFLTADLVLADNASRKDHLWYVVDADDAKVAARDREDGTYPWTEIEPWVVGQLIHVSFDWDEGRRYALKIGDEWHEAHDIGMLEDWDSVGVLFASKENAEIYAATLKEKP